MKKVKLPLNLSVFKEIKPTSCRDINDFPVFNMKEVHRMIELYFGDEIEDLSN
jgi:hypothetical protein